MLALKLLLVPFFIGLVSLAGKRWGPAIAGWLAGTPVVVGPILFLLWLEQGSEFARGAAVYSLAGVAPIVVFAAIYAWVSRRQAWAVSTASAYLAWLLAAVGILAFPLARGSAALLAVGSLLVAPFLFPRLTSIPAPTHLPRLDIALRMVAGAALTLLVMSIATVAGTRITGILALFPIISAVLAVFTHRSGGSDAVIAMLRGLITGLYSLTAFCVTLLFMPANGAAGAFIPAIAVALGVQLLVSGRVGRKRIGSNFPAHPSYHTEPRFRQDMKDRPAGFIGIRSDDMEWISNPKVPGVASVTLIGDSHKAGPLLVRVKLPANIEIAPHTHPDDRT